MSTDDNKAHARRVFERWWNEKDVNAVEELFAPDYVAHTRLPGVEPTRDGLKQWHSAGITAFPDLHFAIEEQIAEGDLVVTRWTVQGTHQHDYLGIPATGKQVTVSGMTIDRMVNGTITEGWLNWDQLGLLQQLGAIPTPE
jgi:steroid delta-isomerase-like uncharacterized protein